MLVLTRITLVATFPVLFTLMATRSAGCAQGPRCQSPEAFAHLVGALEIDEHTRVVVYDAGGPPPAGIVVLTNASVLWISARGP